MTLQADEIKRLAAGHCCQILRSVCGLTDDQLNPKLHGPCPRCKGKDRFRAFDDVNETGGLLCNQCGSRADVLASVQWLTGCTFSEALKLVAEQIGKGSNEHHKSAKPAITKNVHATSEQAADALAWSMANNGTISEQRRPDSEWRYFNADGSDAGIVFRWNLPDGRKEVRQVSRVNNGWVTSAMPEPRPLYRLPDIIDADEVWICEGEKAADAAVSLGLQATTSAGGSGAAEKSDWQPLDGKRVYILPDNDEPGEKFTRDVVGLIRKQAPNATIEVKRLKEDWPKIPDGGDVFDWSEQFDAADAETLRTRLKELPDRCGEYVATDNEGSQNEKADRIDFEIIDSRTFYETNYSTSFLIDGIMTKGQPQLYGGPSKSLKTSVLVDQCLSLAAGVPFLGRFNVLNAKRVLLLSSESGGATLKETAVRICKRKGVELPELERQLFWGFRPPMLTDAEHIATLKSFIQKNKIDVVGIDPAYLSMNFAGNEAANQFAVGAVLMNLTRLQADTGATPILATHFRMHMQPGVMPSLEHVAGAGFGQWARQWVLLNRREAFNDEYPGSHKLFMAFGGSAGHAGAVALDIEEGHIQNGRFWQVSVNHLSAIREQRENEREVRKRDQETRTYESHRAKILKAMRQNPDGASKTQIRDIAVLNSKYFERPFQDLLSAQEIEACIFDRGEVKMDKTLKTYSGFRIVDSASRGTRTQSDTAGHSLEKSDSVGVPNSNE